MSYRSKPILFDYNTIPVSKNVLLSAPDLDYFEMSVIMWVIISLQKHMLFDKGKAINQNVPAIRLHFTDITRKNENRDIVYARLLALRKKDIRYRVLIPGNNLDVTTGLFSSVVREEKCGCVFVDIEKAALPWLLALGIGYSRLEANVFFNCSSVYLRRLYMFICSKMINSSALFISSIEDIRNALGCPETESVSRIISRYFVPLKEVFDNKQIGSHYSLDFKPIMAEKTGRVGRGRYSRIQVNVVLKEQYTRGGNQNVKVISILQLYYNNCTRRADLRPLSEVAEEMANRSGAQEHFLSLDAKYRKEYKGDIVHTANTVFMAMRDQLHIVVYKKNQMGKKDRSI